MNFDNYTIRLAQPADLPAWFDLTDRNRTRLEDFFAGTIAVTRTFEDAKTHFADLTAKTAEGKHYLFLIIDDSTGAVIASLQIKNPDWSIPKAEMGYYVDAAYEGKGIVSRALAKIIAYGFEELALSKLYIRTYEGNVSSRRVAEKNGLTHEGTIRRDYKMTNGTVVDLMYYGITREEYDTRISSGAATTLSEENSVSPIAYRTIHWPDMAVEKAAGATGNASSRTLQLPGLRIRIVDYSPGYLADHWCRKGHIVHCLEGSFQTEIKDGGKYRLDAGNSYVVSDEMSSHRSYSETGTQLLIIDGDFLAIK